MNRTPSRGAAPGRLRDSNRGPHGHCRSGIVSLQWPTVERRGHSWIAITLSAHATRASSRSAMRPERHRHVAPCYLARTCVRRAWRAVWRDRLAAGHPEDTASTLYVHREPTRSHRHALLHRYDDERWAVSLRHRLFRLWRSAGPQGFCCRGLVRFHHDTVHARRWRVCTAANSPDDR